VSCFDSCPPCKGCAAKDEEIVTLRRELSEARGALRKMANEDNRELRFALIRALSSAPAAPGDQQ
jgi:hypothetical protein